MHVEEVAMRFTLIWGQHLPQSRKMRSGRAWLAATGVLLLTAILSPGQNPSTAAPTTPPRSPTLLSPEANRPPDANDQMLMREAKARKTNFDAANAERLKQITQASQILQTLAIALEAEIEKDPSGDISANELQKADNIEKLARVVKERMKLTVAPN